MHSVSHLMSWIVKQNVFAFFISCFSGYEDKNKLGKDLDNEVSMWYAFLSAIGCISQRWPQQYLPSYILFLNYDFDTSLIESSAPCLPHPLKVGEILVILTKSKMEVMLYISQGSIIKSNYSFYLTPWSNYTLEAFNRHINKPPWAIEL